MRPSSPDLTTRERLSGLTLSSITIAWVWRVGKRLYLLPRPGHPGGTPQASSLRYESSRQQCPKCRTYQLRMALEAPEDLPSNKHIFMGAENPCVAYD